MALILSVSSRVPLASPLMLVERMLMVDLVLLCRENGFIEIFFVFFVFFSYSLLLLVSDVQVTLLRVYLGWRKSSPSPGGRGRVPDGVVFSIPFPKLGGQFLEKARISKRGPDNKSRKNKKRQSDRFGKRSGGGPRYVLLVVVFPDPWFEFQ